MSRTFWIIPCVLLVLLTTITTGGCRRNAPVQAPPARATLGLKASLMPAAPFALFNDTGKAVIYTAGGVGGGADVARLVITRSSKVFSDQPEVREIGPQAFLEQLPEIKNATSFKTRAVTYDGVPGYETTAIVFDSSTNAKLHACCVKLYASDGTHTILGLAPVESQLLQQLCDGAATFTAK